MGTWEPNTCTPETEGNNCLIEIQPGTWAPVRWIRICPDHQAITDDTERWSIVTNENARGGSNAINEVLINAPTGAVDIDPQNGNRSFKQGINVSWNWSGNIPNRVLVITITGITLTTNQKNSIKNKLDTRFGIDNVVIVN